jgi:ribose transport system permease protein
MLAYGNSVQSAELIGISSSKVVITAHVISGFLAAIAGMLVVCRLQLGTPNIGDSWLLPSFAAPVIGGAILAGGKVDVIATSLGVLIVAIISQALVIFKIDPFFVQIFLGVMILLAVFVNRYREYKQEARRKIFSSE